MNPLEFLSPDDKLDIEFARTERKPIERDLRIPVARWLLARGLIPVCEVYSLRNCDMVGFELQEKPFRLTKMVAIELKMVDVASVIRQCTNHLGLANETWAAMPPVSLRSIQKFANAGIGLLQVSNGEVKIILESNVRTVKLDRWVKVAARRREEYKTRFAHPEFLSEKTLQCRPQTNDISIHGDDSESKKEASADGAH